MSRELYGQLFAYMDEVRNLQQENKDRHGIAIYRIGECVPDWS